MTARVKAFRLTLLFQNFIVNVLFLIYWLFSWFFTIISSQLSCSESKVQQHSWQGSQP